MWGYVLGGGGGVGICAVLLYPTCVVVGGIRFMIWLRCVIEDKKCFVLSWMIKYSN
jgi:hypothetical protein